MKNLNTLLGTILFFVFFNAPLQAQDTILVQTFNWNSSTRSDTFQFPNDPNLQFRKIWMRYNMRCHNAAVGNGNVGCYEWDYSCNSFIYDPSRVDSTLETHSTHDISNFSGTVFDYTTVPTYGYVQYAQHNPSLDIANELTGTVGAGNETQAMSETQKLGRAQYLYTAAELQNAGLSAGPIHAIELEPLLGGQLGFLRIRIKSSTKTALDGQNPDIDGFTEVYFLDTDIQTGSPQRFVFYQPFDWDGISNLLLDLSYNYNPANSFVAVQASETGFNSALLSNTTDFSLHFEGAGDVTLPSDKFSSISDEITISLWAYGIPEIMPANSTALEGTDDNNQRQVNVHLPWSDGQVYWDCGNSGGGYDRINQAANTADYEGQWNHWAFTKNAGTGEMSIFLNGELWLSATGKTKPINVTNFKLGSSVSGGNHYFGNLDELQVWNKALDGPTIQAWMRQSITPSHPFYSNLVAYFALDEGSGFVATDQVGNGPDADIHLPDWKAVRGKDLYKNFNTSTLRPNTTFVQGDVSLTDVVSTVLDSTLNAQHAVVYYGLNGTNLITTDTQYFYQAGYMGIHDENGPLIDSIYVVPEGSITPGLLNYYTKATAKYELLSLVTPYGNGLNLTNKGKTFLFDVTDYAPILKGNKRFSIEMGGQNQEELDIDFLFITGTPPRTVQNIQPIWPFRRGNYDQIQNDRYFEPRQVALSPNGYFFKIRSAITGHGQNGEFEPRNHYINLDGGNQDFTYDVWKECADNPIYPQGGTWIFDRAGWCPGAATDVHEFDISNLVQPGASVEIDYGVNGPYMSDANYLVNNQLVTYGDWNFNLDASLERIARPNSTDVEFERINPICSNPLVWVKNTGASPITSIRFEYKTNGGSGTLSYNWAGLLQPDALAQIDLPAPDALFWENSNLIKTFEVRIALVNGVPDGNTDNNLASTTYKPAKVFTNNFGYEMYVRTNNNGFENSYILKNAVGDTVLQRNNMEANTTYVDALDLLPGCYSLEFFDTGNDGLSFWYFPEYGSGSFKINRIINGAGFTAQAFNSDFGAGVVFDFVIDDLIGVGTNQQDQNRIFTVFPNPATDEIQVALQGFEGEAISLELYDAQGQLLTNQPCGNISTNNWQQTIPLNTLPKGFYFLKVRSAHKTWARKVVKG